MKAFIRQVRQEAIKEIIKAVRSTYTTKEPELIDKGDIEAKIAELKKKEGI